MMHFLKQTRSISTLSVALSLLFGAAHAAPSPSQSAKSPFFQGAEQSASVAGKVLTKIHRWLHERALPKIDPQTGLYFADGRWNYRDTAADCYPFLVWAAWTVDRQALNGPVRAVLHAERRLCNVVDRIPMPYDPKRHTVLHLPYEQMVFEASEYVKDGLVAIVEITGKDEWFDRMREIEDDLWRHARVKGPAGLLLTKNLEVNGEQLQVLSRLYTMTGDLRYLEWAERIAEYYFQQPNFVPNRLRDHGCEIISGLGLLLGVEAEAGRQEKVRRYAPWIRRMYDTILARGCNPDGMMYNEIERREFGAHYRDFSDGWGYNYVGFLCYDIALKTHTYTPAVRRILTALSKPIYQDYRWEGSIDGIADSLEGALYLLNRVPVQQGFDWVEREARKHLVFLDQPDQLWGTMKLQSNAVRTAILYALWHTCGLTLHPWRSDLKLGARKTPNGSLAVFLQAERPYRGWLELDLPRHRLYMGFHHDWPRINTIPEWFVVQPDQVYMVQNLNTGKISHHTGRQLHFGYAIELAPHQPLRLWIQPSQKSQTK